MDGLCESSRHPMSLPSLIRRFVRCALALWTFLPAPASPVWGDEGPPSWAYPEKPPDFLPTPDDGSLRRVPGSAASFTLTQLRDLFRAPDWHPADHAPMPDVVAYGRRPEVYACGFCHRAEGTGGPENARLAGLPAAYIVQQMADFKSGARGTSVPNRLPTSAMIAVARAATDTEVAAAAAYFSALAPRRSIRVVETAAVPKTYVAGWFLAAAPAGAREPIGARILEVPEDLERFESRDSRAGFLAYVPIGSIRQGQVLAEHGGVSAGDQQTVPCATCHGPGLRGLGPVPGIAGRSPSYVVRQLWDFRHGARAGPSSVLMRPVVEKLTLDEMIALAAYLASLPP
jgi:cytochrome c553